MKSLAVSARIASRRVLSFPVIHGTAQLYRAASRRGLGALYADFHHLIASWDIEWP